jgi:hypothetical protein
MNRRSALSSVLGLVAVVALGSAASASVSSPDIQRVVSTVQWMNVAPGASSMLATQRAPVPGEEYVVLDVIRPPELGPLVAYEVDGRVTTLRFEDGSWLTRRVVGRLTDRGLSACAVTEWQWFNASDRARSVALDVSMESYAPRAA